MDYCFIVYIRDSKDCSSGYTATFGASGELYMYVMKDSENYFIIFVRD